MRGAKLRRVRRKMQMIFQDPFASLDPRMTVGDIIQEPLDNYGIGTGKERQRRVQELLRLVGLNPNFTNRYPHEFSGGQRQRIGIARALAVNPSFIVCDEAVSALDVSIQAQIINLLQDLQREFNLTYLFIAHDLAVVRHLSDRIAVMYLGKIVETAGQNDIYDHPQHPYTRALLSSIPVPDPAVERARAPILLKGEIPSPVNPPSGCRFHTRCPIARAPGICSEQEPVLEPHGQADQMAACHFAGEK
jgi:oligopeptide transport system ATP-binding protein